MEEIQLTQVDLENGHKTVVAINVSSGNMVTPQWKAAYVPNLTQHL